MVESRKGYNSDRISQSYFAIISLTTSLKYCSLKKSKIILSGGSCETIYYRFVLSLCFYFV